MDASENDGITERSTEDESGLETWKENLNEELYIGEAENVAKLLESEHMYDSSAFHTCIMTFNIEKLAHMLKRSATYVNQTEPELPMDIVLAHNNLNKDDDRAFKLLRLLIDYGADVNLVSNQSLKNLCIHPAILRMLLDAGLQSFDANKNRNLLALILPNHEDRLRRKAGWDVINMVLENGSDEMFADPWVLSFVCGNGHYPIVLKMLPRCPPQVMRGHKRLLSETDMLRDDGRCQNPLCWSINNMLTHGTDDCLRCIYYLLRLNVSMEGESSEDPDHHIHPFDQPMLIAASPLKSSKLFTLMQMLLKFGFPQRHFTAFLFKYKSQYGVVSLMLKYQLQSLMQLSRDQIRKSVGPSHHLKERIDTLPLPKALKETLLLKDVIHEL